MQKANLIIDLFPLRDAYTGIAAYCHDVIDSLEKMNAEQYFNITLFTPPNATAQCKERYPVNTIHKLHKFFIPNKGRYDLWHTTFQYSKYFPENYSGKRLLTIHDLNFLHEEITEEKRKRLFKEIGHRIRKAEKIVTISNFVKEDIIKTYDTTPSKIEVIYRCLPKGMPTIATPDYQPNRPFFFAIGMIEDKKNFKALPAMLLHNNCELIIAGKTNDTQYCQAIMSYATILGVANRVHIVGAIDDGARNWYLRNCALFAFPSKAEGFGLPIIEAMRFGKPVLLSRTTSLPEIGGDIAFYLDNFEKETVALATDRALSETDSNPELSTLSRQRAELFSWENAAIQYMDLYKKMVDIV